MRYYRVYFEPFIGCGWPTPHARSFNHFDKAEKFARERRICTFVGCNHKASIVTGTGGNFKTLATFDSYGKHDAVLAEEEGK